MIQEVQKVVWLTLFCLMHFLGHSVHFQLREDKFFKIISLPTLRELNFADSSMIEILRELIFAETRDSNFAGI